MTIAKRWRCTTGGFAPLALTPCGTALGRGHLSERSAYAVIRGLAQKQLKWFAKLWTTDNMTKQIIKSGPLSSTYTEALYNGFSCFPCLQEITATWRTLCSRRGSSISFCSLNKIHRHNSGPAKTPSLPPMLSLYQDLATSPVLQKPSLWKNFDRHKHQKNSQSRCFHSHHPELPTTNLVNIAWHPRKLIHSKKGLGMSKLIETLDNPSM